MHRLTIKKGEVFKRLTVLKEVEPYISPKKLKFRKVLCQCNCGKQKEIIYHSLRRGDTKSCGCIRKEKAFNLGLFNKASLTHGMTRTRFYNIFCGINTRCNNKNCKEYKNYGGRGIKCEWENFEDFKNDMYQSYLAHCREFTEKNTSIERKNNNLGYYKENCKWAIIKEQANNTRNNVFITYKRQTLTMKQWSEKTKINYNTLYYRINKNWSIEKVFEMTAYKLSDELKLN